MASVNMTFSLHGMKVTMYNTRPAFSWLQLLSKRQYGFFDRFSLSTCRCYYKIKSYKGSTEPVSRMTKCRNASRAIIPKMFHKNMFPYQSSDSAFQFHATQIKHPVNANFSNNSGSHANCHRHCWNCGRDTNPVRELFFCDCGVVQKPACELTYFDLMQLKPSFDIDIKQLGDVFKETQKRLHPDKFSTKKQEEKDLAQQQSSLLNKAYTTLQKPLSRAIYLLSLQNIEISEKDSFTEPQLLLEIMEVNEQISSAHSTSDIEGLEKTNDAKIAKCVKEISLLYNSNILNDMKNATIKLRYYTTIQERINELKRSRMG